MAREVILDANVIVAQLDRADVLSERAADLGQRLRGDGAEPVLLDFLVAEAVSVLCRRARERSRDQPEIPSILRVVRGWADAGAVRWSAGQSERLFGPALAVIEETGGRLNFNDGLLVVLQREGVVGDVASFDRGFDAVSGFRRVE